MSDRLTRTPKTWFIECKYCLTTDRGHERELRAKAKRLCKNINHPDPTQRSHFLAYLEAELDLLDHTNLSDAAQIEILTTIHDKTGCTCLSDLTQQIERAITNSSEVTIPTNLTAPSNPTNHNNQHKLKPQRSTILDRIRAQTPNQ